MDMSTRIERQLSERILEDFIRIDNKISEEASKHAMNYRGEYREIYKEFFIIEWNRYLRSN